MNDTVSVIIPCYNRASFIPNAIQSIMKQNYINLELIIVDDRSTDDTKAVVDELKIEYPQIRYFSNNRLQGPSGARNTGLLNSTGDYIAFLDSDDLWIDGHLITGIKFLEENPHVGVLFGNYRTVDFNSGKHLYDFFNRKTILHELSTSELSNNIKIIEDNIFIALIQENFFDLGTSLVKRPFANNILFDESVMFAEDRDFAIKLYKLKNAIFAFREDAVLIKYIHDSNLYFSGDQGIWHKTINAHLNLFEKYLKDYNLTIHEKSILNTLYAKRLKSLSYIYRTNRQYGNALKTLLNSFKYHVTGAIQNASFNLL